MLKRSVLIISLFASATNLFAAIEPAELAARRARLAAAIGPNGMFIALPAGTYTRAGDSEFPFRQTSTLLYLTGIDAPETSLVILPGESENREALFVRNRDPFAEVWTGRIATFDEMRAKTGISVVASSTQRDQFIHAAITGRSWGDSPIYRVYRPPGMPRFREAVKKGTAEIWIPLEEHPNSEETITSEMRLANDLRRRYPEIRIRDAFPVLLAMREVKSPAEIATIQRAIDVTVAAQKAAMRRVLTATHEYQVEATIEYTFRDLGACCPGFASIVASGANSTTLHYETNNDGIVREGLLLTDIGAEMDGYTADVTRTYPADGTFSPEQRTIYEAVLAAQEESLALMKKGETLVPVHAKAEEVLGRTLLRIGLITKNEPPQVRLYFLHGLGHHLGLEVHDVFDRTRKFEPGMVLTNEPGLYVRKNDVLASAVYRQLSDSEQKTIAAALERYDGIGVRIEDDVLVTVGAPRMLSAGAPRTVAEIEAWMAVKN